MSEKRLESLDEQGRRLAVAFAEAENASQVSARPKRRRRFLLAAAGGLAVAIVAALAIAGQGGGDGGGGIFTVEQAVAAVSRAAFAQPGAEPAKYVYEKTRNSSLSGGKTNGVGAYSRTTTVTTEKWSRKGEKKGWLRVTFGDGAFPTDADRLAFEKINRSAQQNANARGKSFQPTPSEENYVCHTILANSEPLGTPGAVLQLKNESATPTTARSIYRRLLKLTRAQPGTYAGGDDSIVWASIGWAMQGGAPRLTPAQRAAFVGALAYIHGVRTLGRTTDPNGNPTIGFVRDAGGRRDVLYFDADSSQTTYLAQTLTRPKKLVFTTVPAGTTIWSHELLDYRYLDVLPPLKQSKPTKNSIAWMQCPELRHTKSKRRATASK